MGVGSGLYIHVSPKGVVAEHAAACKTAKYTELECRYLLQPIAMKRSAQITVRQPLILSGLG